jgi:hypothetical protein
MTAEDKLAIARDVINALAAIIGNVLPPSARDIKREHNCEGSFVWNYIHAKEMLKVWREIDG